MAHKLTVLVADGLAKEGLDLLRKNPLIQLEAHDALDRTQLKEQLPNVNILIVRSRTIVDKDLLERAHNLKLVLRAGIGLDNVDLNAATEKGIVVMNAPTGNIVTTAEHTLAMIFAISRKIAAADASIRQGKWEKKKFQGSELRGKTLGVVGLGNIGRAVAERAQGIGMKVIGFDPYVGEEAALKLNIRLLKLDQLLSEADYVTLHVPLSQTTQGLINKAAIKKMKDGAYLINCARGGLIDEAALLESLNEKHLAGAALDVFEQEPPTQENPLLTCPEVVLTPHLGASTDEAQVQVSLEVAEQVALFVGEGVLKNAINVPNINLEQLKVLKPYLTLCERLGSFIAQISPTEKIKRLRIHYEGAIGDKNREVLTLSVLKGFLSPLLSTPVNFVNARNLFKERGVRVEDSFEAECADYTGLVEITLEGAQDVSVAGTIFGKDEPRIVRIDRFNIDAIPEGHLLFTKNIDTPGVIGALGTVLGACGVNIARMHLGREPKKGSAIALINIDSAPSKDTIEALRKTKGMVSVQTIKF